MASSGEEIQMTVLTKPATIVAMTPMPEYRFQKKESKIAGDNVQPIPAHAKRGVDMKHGKQRLARSRNLRAEVKHHKAKNKDGRKP